MQTIRVKNLETNHFAATIGRNTAFGVVAKIAQVATRLVTVPVVIAHLGLGGYGIWSIIMTTAAYMRFGSIGIKCAFQKYVAEATGDGNFERANKLLSTGCAIMLVLSLVVLLPLAYFSHKIATLAGVPSDFLTSSAHAFTMLALVMVIANVGAVYEAIVMGGHRVDLARNFSTAFTIVEAVAIVTLLHFGGGLFAMASVMAASELAFIICCYVASKKIVPQIRLRLAHVTRSVARELVRFAGSYQLVSILEIAYLSIVPITLLRMFGPDSAGIYALTTRLSGAAIMLPDALLLPILSGAAMVFASGSSEEMRTLIAKSFKVTLGLGLFPLGFIMLFGPVIVLAWTGEAASILPRAFLPVCAAALFQTFSILGLVLYRASGKAFLDNVRQAIRVAILLAIALMAHRLGFYGILAGLAVAEFFGMGFMLFALTKAFDVFHVKLLLPDALKLTAAVVIVLGSAWLVSMLSLPVVSGPRVAALIELSVISLTCVVAAWPALILTRSISKRERNALFSVFWSRRRPDERQGQTVEVAS